MLSKRETVRLPLKFVRGKMRKLGITEKEVAEAVQPARTRRKQKIR
jgi:hypothetical protein